MFKRGMVVEHKSESWIGVVLQPEEGYYVAVKWFEGRNGGGYVLIDAVMPIDGYAFEAALALGDTATAIRLYREAQAAERERDAARESYNAIHEIVFAEWFNMFPDYAFDGGQLPHHIKSLFEHFRRERGAPDRFYVYRKDDYEPGGLEYWTAFETVDEAKREIETGLMCDEMRVVRAHQNVLAEILDYTRGWNADYTEVVYRWEIREQTPHPSTARKENANE